jgi:tRNA A58 N-methylase Trm61
MNLNAQLKVANKKNEAQSKTLEKARSALVKFEFDSGSMNDKDWGDVIRWVLPETKVDFLLIDLKKKEDILAKLATLPNSWTTYIPCMEQTLPVVPTATV